MRVWVVLEGFFYTCIAISLHVCCKGIWSYRDLLRAIDKDDDHVVEVFTSVFSGSPCIPGGVVRLIGV